MAIASRVEDPSTPPAFGLESSDQEEPVDYEIDMSDDQPEEPSGPDPKKFDINLVDFLDKKALTEIATKVIDGYKVDVQSRADLDKMIEKGIKLLGTRLEDVTEPFPGACNAVHPIVLESAVKFQSKAIQELYPPGGPVRTKILGDETPEKVQKANRIKGFMDFQQCEQMEDNYDEDEKLLINLPICGTSFKKLYYDDALERLDSEFLPFSTFYVNYWASSLKKAARYTHVQPISEDELLKRQKSGVYADIELGSPSKPEQSALQQTIDRATGLSMPDGDLDLRYTLLEQHVGLSIDEDPYNEEGVEVPYIVVVELTSQEVLSIRRNWIPEDKRKEKVCWFVAFSYVPFLGIYGLGLPHLIGNLADSATFALRSLADAGQFANLPAGFKTRGLKLPGKNVPFRPGEWRDVEVTGLNKVSDMIAPLSYKEPSAQLFNLLQYIDARAQRFADSTEQVVADSTNYGPVGTTLALLEASTKFYASIFKRVHKSKRQEFKLQYLINSLYLPKEYPYDVEGAQRMIYKSDFDGSIDVLPVSDPNVPSQSHRIAKADLVIGAAMKNPQLHDMREVYRRAYQAADIPEIDKIMPPPKAAFSGDPVSENILMAQGEPVQATITQDHQAHITTHQAFVKDPTIGGNPMFQGAQGAILDHIKSHMLQDYQRKVEMSTGLKIQPGQQLPPGQEIPMSEKEAEVAQKIALVNTQQDNSTEARMVAVEERKVAVSEKAQDSNSKLDIVKMAGTLRELDRKDEESTDKVMLTRIDQLLERQKMEMDQVVEMMKIALEAAGLKMEDKQMKAERLLQEKQIAADKEMKQAEKDAKSEEVAQQRHDAFVQALKEMTRQTAESHMELTKAIKSPKKIIKDKSGAKKVVTE